MGASLLRVVVRVAIFTRELLHVRRNNVNKTGCFLKAHSQLFDSQPSQPIPGMVTLNPYQLPSVPVLRARGRDPSLASPSQQVGQRGLSRRNPAVSSRGRAFRHEPLRREGTGAGLEGIPDGDEE